jgi:hypothetical protein
MFLNRLFNSLFLLLLCHFSYLQGTIEAESINVDSVKAVVVKADTLIGDGSKIENISHFPQNLGVSPIGDTLFITDGNWVIIPNISTSNSGNAFANAGADIYDACITIFELSASPLSDGTTGEWVIVSGDGGSLINPTFPNGTFIGVEGESYLLQWNVSNPNGSGSFDQKTISIAENTITSIADAGTDSFAIMSQSIILYANLPEVGSQGKWSILSGIGGVLSNDSDATTLFTGVPGESYTLRWQHFNSCSTSSDELILSFSQSASGEPSASGRYYIPDEKFRQYLKIIYPSSMDMDSLILSEANSITHLLMNNLGVENLDGIQYLSSVEQLSIDNNPNLITIPYLSPVLRRLECDDCNSLRIIPNFPSSLDTLSLGWAQLSVISELPVGLRYLELDFIYTLNQIPEIPDSCAKVWLIHNGPCGLQPPPCEIADTINIPSLCQEFWAVHMGIKIFPQLPDSSTILESLNLSINSIEIMPSLVRFENLISFGIGDNSLLKLDSLPNLLEHFDFFGNPIICVENKPPLVADRLSEYIICP